uniref:Uncharacterized protein n=1 Tax=Anopheles albimanus TaxID=7167 RepID=A0A182FBF5_ANOAL
MKKLLIVTCVVLIASSVLAEIIIDSRTLIGMQNRTDESAIWCDVFYSDDFPDNSVCSGKPDDIWEIFPSCCNGAYNCRSEVVWNMYLCPSSYVYDSLLERCTELVGDRCPYEGNNPSDGEMTTPEPAPEVTCGTARTGKLPYGTDCTRFIKCTRGEGTLEDCPAGYVFYIPFAACLPGNRSTCQLLTV